MPSGKTPTPTHIKEIMGNPGHRPLPENEPLPEGDLHSAPAWMNEEQKAQWNFAIDNAPDGMLKFLDQETLATWVVAVCIHREAAIRVAQDGLIVKSPLKGVDMQNPYLAILNKQALLIVKTGNELGFSPAARVKLSINSDTDKGKNYKKPHSPLNEFLN